MKLNIGDNAPNFKGVDQNGNSVALSNFKGKNLIMYFYPKDNTPGCTAEACDLRDNYEMWIERCEYMKTQDLPDNWNGVFIARTK